MAAGTTCRFAWEMVIDATNNTIRFDDGSGAGWVDATISLGGGSSATYYWLFDGSADDMAKALADALAAASGGGYTYTITLSSKLLDLQSSAAVVWRLDFSHVNTTADRDWFGFPNALESSDGSGNMTGTNQPLRLWYPSEAIWQDDSEDRPRYISGQRIMGDGSTSALQWGSARYERTLDIVVLQKSVVFAEFEDVQGEAWMSEKDGGERPSDLWAQGLVFAFTPDTSAPTVWRLYVPLGTTRVEFEWHEAPVPYLRASFPVLRHQA